MTYTIGTLGPRQFLISFLSLISFKTKCPKGDMGLDNMIHFVALFNLIYGILLHTPVTASPFPLAVPNSGQLSLQQDIPITFGSTLGC